MTTNNLDECKREYFGLKERVITYLPIFLRKNGATSIEVAEALKHILIEGYGHD